MFLSIKLNEWLIKWWIVLWRFECVWIDFNDRRCLFLLCDIKKQKQKTIGNHKIIILKQMIFLLKHFCNFYYNKISFVKGENEIYFHMNFYKDCFTWSNYTRLNGRKKRMFSKNFLTINYFLGYFYLLFVCFVSCFLDYYSHFVVIKIFFFKKLWKDKNFQKKKRFFVEANCDF